MNFFDINLCKYSQKHKINIFGIIITILTCFFIVSCCSDSTGPQGNGESVLSIDDYSHFHCELSWTQMNITGYEFDSYNLYRSKSPDISSDTTVTDCIATYFGINELEHADSLLEVGSGYYYALLTKVLETEKLYLNMWSNELFLQTKQIINVEIINNSGQKMYVEANQSVPAQDKWLSNIGEKSHWVSGFDQSTCVISIVSGDTLCFAYPEYDQSKPHGVRIYFGETEFTGAPDLATADFIYDKVETGWIAVWNTSCVDFVAFPTQLTVNGNKYGFLSTVTRSNLISSLQSMPSPYNNLVFPQGSTDPVRFFSPGHFLSSPDTLDNCLDSAFQLGLPLLVGSSWSYGNDTYTNITYQSPDGMTALHNGSDIVTASNINTVNVFANAIPNTGIGGPRFAALIGAAANRGVLYDYDKWDSPEDYYISRPASNAGQYNYYSEVLHSLSIDGKCYGMAYDDYYEQLSGTTVNPGDSVTITILPFNEM